jgi:dipeptidyl-peptidase-4
MTADLTAQYLAELGFAVWKTDNRGTPRRGHAFEAAIYHNMGDVEVRDQADGVKFVGASRPEVDISRVGVTGGSYGGYMTLRCLTEAPDVFRAGVAIAPVTDWDGYDTGYTERYMGTPADNPGGYKASSVLDHAGRLAGKLLVIHGMLDENVHFRHTARLATALITAGKPFDLLPLPDERHSARREADRRYVADRMATFFEAALQDKR